MSSGGGRGSRPPRVALPGTVLLLVLTSCHPLDPQGPRVEAIHESFGVIREQRLTDGIVPASESPIDDFTAALFLVPGARVVYRLPPSASGPLELIAASGPDGATAGVVIEASADGASWRELVLHRAGDQGPMGVFVSPPLERSTRLLQVRLPADIPMAAVGELRLTAAARSTLRPQTPPTYQASVDRLLGQRETIRRLSIGLGFLLLPAVFLVVGDAGPRRRLRTVALAVLGVASWLGFGTLHGDGRLLHPWELTHYYLGSKYFPELRYRELYRCIAAHELAAGRGRMVQATQVRNLDDNRLHPSAWSATDAGDCRAEFTPTRWEDFGRDTDDLRRLFRYRHFHKLLRDHGYNATPLQSVVLRRMAGLSRPSEAWLTRLAWLDLMTLAAGLVLLAWAFGTVPAAIACLLLGFGQAWDFSWTGGSLGRYLWLFCLLGGVALLRRQRPACGAALLTLAGLLRLFPFVLLAGLAWRFLRRAAGRKLQAEDLRVASGVALTLFMGLVIPAWDQGGEVYPEFLANSRLHASRPPGNDLGLGALLSTGLTESALSATAGSGLGARKLGWLLGLGLAGLLVIRIDRQPSESWELVVWSGVLLYASLPLSGYDYVWVLLLAPTLSTHAGRAVVAVGLVVLTRLAPEWSVEMVDQTFSINVALLLGLTALAAHEWRAQSALSSRPAA